MWRPVGGGRTVHNGAGDSDSTQRHSDHTLDGNGKRGEDGPIVDILARCCRNAGKCERFLDARKVEAPVEPTAQ
jgi:hypothetical protein